MVTSNIPNLRLEVIRGCITCIHRKCNSRYCLKYNCNVENGLLCDSYIPDIGDWPKPKAEIIGSHSGPNGEIITFLPSGMRISVADHTVKK